MLYYLVIRKQKTLRLKKIQNNQNMYYFCQAPPGFHAEKYSYVNKYRMYVNDFCTIGIWNLLCVKQIGQDRNSKTKPSMYNLYDMYIKLKMTMSP